MTSREKKSGRGFPELQLGEKSKGVRDFFTAALWHQTVGSRVLAVRPPHPGRTLRAYARCSRSGKGAVTLVVVNVGQQARGVTVALKGGAFPAHAEQRMYNLRAADGTHSSRVASLNGRALALANGGMPQFKPIIKPAGREVAVAALGVALIDVDAHAHACL